MIISADEPKAIVAMLRHFGWDRVSIFPTPHLQYISRTRERPVGVHDDDSGEWLKAILPTRTLGWV
jgi:hypothetical protein